MVLLHRIMSIYVIDIGGNVEVLSLLFFLCFCCCLERIA